MAYASQDEWDSNRVYWGLVPGVTDLAAFYDPPRQLLTLFSNGTTKQIVSGFEFVRDEHFVGGLRYKFMCWVGPARGKATSYKWSQKFQIAYDPRVMLLDVVFICTADHPEGQETDIKWGGLKPKPPPNAAAQGSGPLVVATAVSLPPPIVLSVWYQVPFKIFEQVKATGVTIRFDKRSLQLLDAGVGTDGELFWELLPVLLGPTSVTITYTASTPIYGNQVLYDVNVGFPVSKSTILPSGDEKYNGAVLSWLGSVNLAFRAVRSKWPDAELYNVDCQTPKIGPVYPRREAHDLSCLTALFRVGDKGTVKISTKGGWSHCDAPAHHSGFVIGPRNITWPPHPQTWDLGLEDAVEKLHEHKSAPPSFWSCDFCQVLKPQPGVEQPVYSFLMVDGSTWSVGAKDGQVWKDHGAVRIQSEQKDDTSDYSCSGACKPQ